MNNQNDLRRFSKMISVLEVTFDKELSQEAKDAYWIALEDLPIESLERAGKQAMRECAFFPKPAELRKRVEGTPEDAATKAWTDLQSAYRRAGFWTSVLFADGAIAAAIEYVFGTWSLCSEQLNTLSPEMLRAKQKEFCDAYRRAVREGKTAPKYLRGYCEINNLETAGKWKRGQPVTIGDRVILPQFVFVQGKDGGRMVEAEFDFYSGSLLTPPSELVGRPALSALSPGREAKLLSAGSGERIDPEEGKQMVADAVADLVGLMRMPKLRDVPTEAEWEARRLELKRQAEQLSGR